MRILVAVLLIAATTIVGATRNPFDVAHPSTSLGVTLSLSKGQGTPIDSAQGKHASVAADSWRQWGGPNRNFIVNSTGLADTWPETVTGPFLLVQF
jgi:hypothetical protein